MSLAFVSELQTRDTSEPKKNPATFALGRRGGFKDGKIRAKLLSPKKRSKLIPNAYMKP